MEMLVFVEGGKPENFEKNPRRRDENQQQTQPTCDAGTESNPGHIGGRRALSPLRYVSPLLPDCDRVQLEQILKR